MVATSSLILFVVRRAIAAPVAPKTSQAGTRGQPGIFGFAGSQTRLDDDRAERADSGVRYLRSCLV